jgi:hypothetical protein
LRERDASFAPAPTAQTGRLAAGVARWHLEHSCHRLIVERPGAETQFEPSARNLVDGRRGASNQHR